MKRHDGMRGIADQQQGFPVVPLRAVHRAEQPLRVRCKLFGQVRNERQHIGEMRREEPAHLVVAVELVEAWRGVAVARQKQCCREAAVGIGQRNQHEAAAWPDVQAIHGKHRLACAHWNDQFLVVVRQARFGDGEPAKLRQGVAQRRAGAVCAR